MITSWRLVRADCIGEAFDARQAAQSPGRWNSAGTPIIDTADSPALAALELLVHLDAEALEREFVFVPARFPESAVLRIDRNALPGNWDDREAPPELRRIGDEWSARRSSLVFAVPSAVMPLQTNYLVNPRHHDFAAMELGAPVTFRFDERLKA